MADLLGLAKPDARVAVIDFVGSFCPITLEHVMCLVEAQNILGGERAPAVAAPEFKPYDAVIAHIRVNSDESTAAKLHEKNELAITSKDRRDLCKLATSAHDLWIKVSQRSPEDWIAELQRRFPQQQYTIWRLNGADDVVRHQKWRNASASTPFITMDRPGHTQEVLNAIHSGHVAPHHFLVGRQLPDISSSAARRALAQADAAEIGRLLHPDVAKWCRQHSPWARALPSTRAVPAATAAVEPVARTESHTYSEPPSAPDSWTKDGVSAFLHEIGLRTHRTASIPSFVSCPAQCCAVCLLPSNPCTAQCYAVCRLQRSWWRCFAIIRSTGRCSLTW